MLELNSSFHLPIIHITDEIIFLLHGERFGNRGHVDCSCRGKEGVGVAKTNSSTVGVVQESSKAEVHVVGLRSLSEQVAIVDVDSACGHFAIGNDHRTRIAEVGVLRHIHHIAHLLTGTKLGSSGRSDNFDRVGRSKVDFSALESLTVVNGKTFEAHHWLLRIALGRRFHPIFLTRSESKSKSGE